MNYNLLCKNKVCCQIRISYFKKNNNGFIKVTKIEFNCLFNNLLVSNNNSFKLFELNI